MTIYIYTSFYFLIYSSFLLTARMRFKSPSKKIQSLDILGFWIDNSVFQDLDLTIYIYLFLHEMT